MNKDNNYYSKRINQQFNVLSSNNNTSTQGLASDISKLTEKQYQILSDFYSKAEVRSSSYMADSIDNLQSGFNSMMKDLEDVSSFTETSLDSMDRLASKTFYGDRKSDLRDLERESRKKFKEIYENGKTTADGLGDKFSGIGDSLRDWSIALNVSPTMDSVKQNADSLMEVKANLSKFTDLSSEEWSQMKADANDFSKSVDNTISSLDYLSNVSDLMIDLHIDDKSMAQELAKYTTNFQAMTDVNVQQLEKALGVSNMEGMGGTDYIKTLTSQVMALQQSDTGVTGQELMDTYNNNIEMFKLNANGDTDKLNNLIESSLALTSATKGAQINGLDENLYKIMNADFNTISELGAQGFDASSIQNLMKSGQMEDAVKLYTDQFNTTINRAGGADTTLGKEFLNQLGIDTTSADSQQLINNLQDSTKLEKLYSSYDSSKEIAQSQATTQDQFVEEWREQVSAGTKFQNWLKNGPVGSFFSNITDTTGMSMGDIAGIAGAVSNIAGLLLKLKGGGEGFSLLNTITSLFSKGGAASEGISTAISSKVGGIFSKFLGTSSGGGLLGSLASVAGGLGSTATGVGAVAVGGGALAGGVAGAVGVLNGIYDLFKGFTDSTLTKQQSDEAKTTGVTKIGMVGGGAAAGAAIGSVIPIFGTAAGALIGAGVGGIAALLKGDDVGKDINSAFNSYDEDGNKIDGSHATGLNYVPKDGYIAELHKGEMVIPQDTSNLIRSGALGFQNEGVIGAINNQGVGLESTKNITNAVSSGVSSAFQGGAGVVISDGIAGALVNNSTQGSNSFDTIISSESANIISQGLTSAVGGIAGGLSTGVAGAINNLIPKDSALGNLTDPNSDKNSNILTKGLSSVLTTVLPKEIGAVLGGVGAIGSTIANSNNTVEDPTDSGSNIGNSFFSSIGGKFKSIWSSFLHEGESSFNQLNGASDVFTDQFKSETSRIFDNNSLLKKLLQQNNSILSLDTMLRFFGNIFEGSHATGLDEVPHDNYRALLHEGEAVLTANDAEVWRSQANSNATNSTNFFSNQYQKALANNSSITSDTSIQSSVPSSSESGIVVESNSSLDATGGLTSTEGSNFSGSKQEFISLIRDGAIQSQSAYNVLPSLTLAQAILESGWGKSAIGNNIFGIKANNNWQGKKQYVWTKEEVNGQMQDVQAWFRDYDSVEESVLDHGKFLTSSRYDNVRSAKDYKEAAKAVQEAGYATASNYSSSLISLIDQYGLNQWDTPQYEVGTPYVPETQLAVVHEGEAIIPAKNNPFNNSSQSSTTSDTTNDNVDKSDIDTLVSTIQSATSTLVSAISALGGLTNSTNNYYKGVSESEQLFAFSKRRTT